MLLALINALFGCSHQRTTFPLTPRRKSAGLVAAPSATRNGTYVVCLDCGQEFAYDWNHMRVGQQVRVPPATANLQTMFRARVPALERTGSSDRLTGPGLVSGGSGT